MKKLFLTSLIIPVILTLLISIFIIPAIYNQEYNFKYYERDIKFTQKRTFIWPMKNYKTITSYFGYRTSPTNGASTYHGGIDIAAPQGAEILAIANGIIKYVGWDGANRIYSTYFARKRRCKHIWARF